jgi:hypothetical protein
MPRRLKYLEINLTQGGKDLYIGNSKSLPKEIKKRLEDLIL